MAHTNVHMLMGNLTTGESTPTFYIDRVNGRVGVGTDATQHTDGTTYAFDVSGSLYATELHGDGSNLTGLTDSKWVESITNPDDIYYTTGNVGIGGEAGTKKLTVHGDINFSGELYQGGSPYVSTPWTIETNPDALTYTSGNVAIGTTSTDHTLTVGGVFNIKDTMTTTMSAYVPDWVARISTPSIVSAYGIAVDGSGNAYVTGGYVNGPLTLYSEDESGGTTKTLTNGGSYDAFIAKYSTGGGVLWAARMSGTSSDKGRRIAVDSNGNVYVAGLFYNSITLYSKDEPGTTKTLTGSGGDELFIAKYSTDGVVLWAARMRGTVSETVNGIAVDSSGNVYVAGHYNGLSITLYSKDEPGTTKTLTNGGSYDAFIAKYSTDGVVLWAARISGQDNDYGTGIAVDSNGNVYVTGDYNSSSITLYSKDEPGTTKTLTNGGPYDTFIAKYSTDGVVLWAARMSGTSSETGVGIAVDNNGNVYVTGHYNSSSITLYSKDEPGTTKTLTNGGSYDVFIAKYSTDGGVLWAARMSGSVTESAYGIAVDSSGNAYVAGRYNSNPLTLYSEDESTGTTKTLTNSSYDAFIAKYSTDGGLLWATRISGPGNDFANAIAVDSSESVYVTGDYNISPITLYSEDESTGTAKTLTSSLYDSFIAKYKILGRIGVGVTNPTTALDVKGDTNISGEITGPGRRMFQTYRGTFTTPIPIVNNVKHIPTGIILGEGFYRCRLSIIGRGAVNGNRHLAFYNVITSERTYSGTTSYYISGTFSPNIRTPTASTMRLYIKLYEVTTTTGEFRIEDNISADSPTGTYDWEVSIDEYIPPYL